jgi:hypothetical protein
LEIECMRGRIVVRRANRLEPCVLEDVWMVD